MEQANGISFPLTGDGKRSTTAVAKKVLAAAVREFEPAAAIQIENERAWRKQYPRHFRRLVEVGLRSPAMAEGIALRGLEALYREMSFVHEGESISIDAAMERPARFDLQTVRIEGRDSEPPSDLAIPYRGQLLTGQELLGQVEDWESRGIIEPTCGDALRRVHDNPEWLDLSDQSFILLGAAAEMGPFRILSRWRAHTVAVDLARPAAWMDLIATARAGNGSLSLPVRGPTRRGSGDAELAAQAGADLIAETPEIGRWLESIADPLVIGAYAYLDGGAHVRVALAMDTLIRAVTQTRRGATVALLPTPSDVFAVPAEAAAMAHERFRDRAGDKLWQEPLRALSGGHLFAPNAAEMLPLAPGRETSIVDSIVLRQGPNYALAKRLQRWRATASRARGIRVSCNVAPSTKTVSVLRNLALAAAYAGADQFGVEIFEPATSNALMATLLVHDLRYEGAAANPAVPLDHPAELFMQGAIHGGLWRAAFSPRSVMEVSGLLGWRSAVAERKVQTASEARRGSQP